MDRGPFIMDTKDYMELGLKRMILWASENGFDKVAWTTGKQQMKRYSLRSHIDKLNIKRSVSDDGYVVTGYKEGIGQPNSVRVNSLDELDEVIGEELAEKTKKDMAELSDPGGQITEYDGVSYSGVDLDITDPKHFLMVAYDKTLKNVAQSLGKKYDARVNQEPLGLPGLGVTKDKVWTLNLSEKLKSAAKQGLPYMAAVPPGALLYQKQQERDRTPVNRAAARPLAMQANAQ